MRKRRFLQRNSKGAALIEVIVAVVVLSMITASVPPVLLALDKSQFTWNERTTAESLARTQIEYIKGCPYIYGNETVPNPAYPIVPVPDASYRIEVTAIPMLIVPIPIPVPSPAPTPGHIPVNFAADETDEGLQQVTVTVYHTDKPIIEIKTYKAYR